MEEAAGRRRPVKLLLDEHFSDRIAVQLRQRGHDVLAASEVPALRGMSDIDLLRWAHTADRLVVTQDAVDFQSLHRRLLEAGEEHSGIVLSPARRLPTHSGAIGAVMKALERFITEESPAHGASGLWWL